MKKIILPCISLLLLSCNSDNEEIQSENNLIGKWKMANTIVISGTDKTTVLKEYLPDDCKQKSSYEYTTGNKYITNDYNMINSECVLKSSTRDYIYNQTDKTLKVENIIANILELSKSNFVLLAPDNYDYNSDGVQDYLKYIFVK
ncbi:hypothetical protein [Chryseobacterium aquaticum]|uniref:hypothetical protein n=1 Tax=Chryseobacterium aquaticum TaxID=452084 RepID=UPI002FC7F492